MLKFTGQLSHGDVIPHADYEDEVLTVESMDPSEQEPNVLKVWVWRWFSDDRDSDGPTEVFFYSGINAAHNVTHNNYTDEVYGPKDTWGKLRDKIMRHNPPLLRNAEWWHNKYGLEASKQNHPSNYKG